MKPPRHVTVLKLMIPLFVLSLGLARAADDDGDFVSLQYLGSYGETIHSVDRHSNDVFLDQGYTLRALDIADPARPAEILWRRFNHEIDSLAIRWPILYLGFNGGSILMLDVTDPAQPVEGEVISHEGRNMYLKMMGDYLLASAITGKVTDYTVYDIRNPSRPIKRLSGERQHGSEHGENDIFATDGSRLFQAEPEDDDEEGNRIVAIRDVTTSATTLGHRIIPLGESVSFEIKDGKLVAGDSASTTSILLMDIPPDADVWGYQYEDGTYNLQSAPSPKPKGTIFVKFDPDHSGSGIQIVENVPGSAPVLRGIYGQNPGAEQIKIAGNRGYLIDGSSGFQVLDLSDPARPRCLGRKSIPATPHPVIRAIDDNLVYITVNDDGYLVLDCSKPAAPAQIAIYSGPSGSTSIQGKRAYVAAGSRGLQILDLSNPRAIRRIGHFPTPKPATDLATSGSLVYLLADELMVIGAANPRKPVLKGKTACALEETEGLDKGTTQLKKLGAAIYVIQQGRGHFNPCCCRVIDVSNPAQPRALTDQIFIEPTEVEGEADTVSFFDRAAVPADSGWYLSLPTSYTETHGGWISIFHAALHVFDLSDPLHPAPLFQINDLQSHEAAALYKGTIYLADGPGGLVIRRPAK